MTMTQHIDRPPQTREVVARLWQCSQKAQHAQEFYSLRSGNLFGSLDAVIYSCDRHHLVPPRTTEDAREKTPRLRVLGAEDVHPPCGTRVDTALQGALARLARLDRRAS